MSKMVASAVLKIFTLQQLS